MTDELDRPLEERFLDEMVEGYLDGFKSDNPEPSLSALAPAQRARAQRLRALARLRHAHLVEECPLAGVHRKTFAQAEFFAF
jgi:hypothetical protein